MSAAELPNARARLVAAAKAHDHAHRKAALELELEASARTLEPVRAGAILAPVEATARELIAATDSLEAMEALLALDTELEELEHAPISTEPVIDPALR